MSNKISMGKVVESIIVFFLKALIVMLCWNFIIPILFPGLVIGGFIIGVITYWQSTVVVLLIGELFHQTYIRILED